MFGGILFGYWKETSFNNLENSQASVQISRKNDLAFVTLSQSSSAVDPHVKIEEEFISPIIQEQSIISSVNVPLRDPEENGGVKIYEVKEGDTISSIATRYKITVNTIIWANDIDNIDSIKPGDKLFILPVAGISYKIKQGDTLEAIAQKYKANKEKIIAFNDLPADESIKEGQEIIIPDGKIETPSTSSSQPESMINRRQYATSSSGQSVVISGFKSTLSGKPGTGHKFPYGYCTWYVAQKRYIPWRGNAGTWLYNAKVAGYKTGKTPVKGAIMVSSESWWGHVGIVESVSEKTFTISEMNHKGWGKVNKRVIDKSSKVIKGFIY